MTIRRSIARDVLGDGHRAPAARRRVTRGLGAKREPASACEQGSTVTVVVTCFNYAEYLVESVFSALSQTGVEVDVIVVDDGSTDNSIAVAHGIAAEDGRVVVLENGLNLGPVATFNRGLAAARGEFVVRLDADDLLTPGSLSRAVAIMQRHPEVGLVYGRPIHFQSRAPRRAARTSPKAWLIWEGRDWLAARCRDGSNVITSPEAVFRRSVSLRVGGQKALRHTHDMEMWLRIAACSDVGYVQGADQAWHREHSQSLSRAADSALVFLPELRAAFEMLFADEVVRRQVDSDALLQSSRRALANEAVDRARHLKQLGRSDSEAAALLRFAGETCSEIRGDIQYLRARGQRGDVGRRRMSTVRALPLRISGWYRNRCRAARWARTGVYEHVRAVDSGRA